MCFIILWSLQFPISTVNTCLGAETLKIYTENIGFKFPRSNLTSAYLILYNTAFVYGRQVYKISIFLVFMERSLVYFKFCFAGVCGAAQEGEILPTH